MIAIGTRAHGVTKRRQLPKMVEHFYTAARPSLNMDN